LRISGLRAFFVALATVAAIAFGATSAVAAEAPPTLSDSAKQDLLVQVLERFVPRAETFWRASDLTQPESDYFEAAGSGVDQARGDGDMAMAFATLLTARPQQAEFGGLSRATIESQTIQVIRHEALTSKLSGAGYNRWGEGTWQASLETYNWAFAAKLLWADLDEETRALVKRVVTGEADILITKPIATGEWGNTGAEDEGWNTATPELAALMWPEDPRAEEWLRTAKKIAINASSIATDATSDEQIDGAPLSEWNASVNLHPDLTLENHGYFNTIYQMVTHLLIGDAAIMAADDGAPIPEAFSFRTEQVYDQILGPMVTGDGDILAPAGQDWTSKDYQHLDYLTIMATRFHRADASVAESRALKEVVKRQSLHADGSILAQKELGYETMLIQRLASAWWNHHLFGPSAQPTAAEYEAALARNDGVHQYPYIDLVDARQRDAFTSMSWDDVRPMGLIVPAPNGHEEDPILAAYVPGSLVGSAASSAGGKYSCDCREDKSFFSTAGLIGARDFSMTSFPDGTTLLLDRGTGSTFNVDFEHIEGLTGERPVYTEGGTGLGNLPGDWWNVADRMGMVVLGGGGIKAEDVETGNPYLQVFGSATTGSGNRGAAVYPDADRETTARLAATADQPATPDGWSALQAQAPDGTDRIAVARWAGPETTDVAFTDERGAPLIERASTIEGDSAQTSWSLEAPASRGEEVRFFVHTDGALSARATGEETAELTNDGDAPVHATITWVGPNGTQTTTRTIAVGEQVTARVIGGKLTTAGPEYELLLEARAKLEAFRSTVATWRKEGKLDPARAAWLTGIDELVLRELGKAIAADGAETPDTARAAAAVERARIELELLRAPFAPKSIQQQVDATRKEVLGLLEGAVTAGLAVNLRLETGDALPGEPLKVRAFVANRSSRAVTDGRLTLAVPAGWGTAPTVTVPTLAPGEARSFDLETVAGDDAEPGSTVQLGVDFSYRQGLRRGTAHGSTGVKVDPLISLRAASPDLPLARGGWNEATLTVANAAPKPLEFDLAASAPEGIGATLPQTTLTVPAEGSAEFTVELRNPSLASGTGELQVSATAGAQQATTTATLHYSDDLALNGLAAAWPAVSASSSQATQPPAFATDGSAGSFWVAAGTKQGEGPQPGKPAYLTVDHGVPVTIAAVTMVPRVNYGPKAYSIEVSEDGQTWKEVASVPAAPNGANTTTFAEPLTARYLRLDITDSWDSVRPPRNVQVAELEERAP
jgi:F5/8 type C domain-containing protein/alpha-galactosidase-like protein